MSNHADPIPEVIDTARRAARTAIQAAAAVITVATALAAVYQAIVPVVGPFSSSNAFAWLIGAALAVGGNAALYAKIMALPSVNALLERIRLGGQSTVAQQADTETRLLSLQGIAGAAGN